MNNPDRSRQAINDIFHLINSGQIDQAQGKCRTYLEKNPDEINVLGLLGAVLLKLGETAEAKSILEKTIQLEPAFAKPYEDLGMLYLHENAPEQAVRYFEDAIRLDGSQAGAYSGLAKALSSLGKGDLADDARQKFLQLSPIARALAEASSLIEKGKATEAEQICEKLLKQNPTNSDVLRLLARVASEDERYVVAEGLLKRIVKLSVNHQQPYSDLGRFLGERGRFPEAVEMLEKAVALDSSVIASQQQLGDFLAILGRPVEALDAYDKVLHLDPDFSPALVGSGHMLRILGRSEEAINAYEAGIAIRPEHGDAWWSLASLRSYRFSAPQFDEMQAQLDSATPGNNSNVSFCFALARAFEDENDFNTAWQYYATGNALKRKLVQYDPVKTEVTHDAIIECFDREFIERQPDHAAEKGLAPIFILGMPRSGSTLLEQILSSHSQVEGTGELPYIIMMSEALGGSRSDGKRYPQVLADMTADQLTSLGKSYVYYAKTSRQSDLPRFTDKMPANFAHVGLIHLALPNARIIDARRHPLDTCIANFRQLFAQGKNHAYDLNECAEYFLEYVRVMDHWDDVLPGRVLKVQYEDVVDDVEGQTRRLLDFCELPWEDACLAFHQSDRPVNSASADQVRLPIYDDAVDYWKNYESQLADIQEILSPVLSGGT